jgi:flotillin
VVAEQVKIEQVQRQEQIKVQELEIQRREKELTATVQKAAEAERQRIEILADAERQRLSSEAAGHAEATRVQGTAEAEIVKAKGQAEAEAMHMRADAFQEYTQAAIVDKMVSALPEITRAMAESFNKVDRITIVSNGDGNSGSALTGEVAKMLSQLPNVVETLTGMSIPQMLDRLHGPRAQGSSTDIAASGTVHPDGAGDKTGVS